MTGTTNKLHVEEAGNPTGPPVLFLHGFMSSNLQWEPNRPHLEPELRLLLTEQLGHGGSPGPDDEAVYQADSVLELVDQVRVDRGLDRLWLCGQSLGGAISVRYALRHPERVEGLIFTNSRAVFGMTGLRAEGEKKPERTGPRREPTREWVQSLPYHPRNAKRIPEDLKARMVEAADAMPLTVFRHQWRSGPWRSSHELDQLQVPTLLINGRFESAFQPCVQQARDSVPDLEVIDLDGGHSVNIDQPEAFARAVLDFIGSR